MTRLWTLQLDHETIGHDQFAIEGAGDNCLALVLLYSGPFVSSQEREEETTFAVLLEAGPLVGTKVFFVVFS